MKPVNKKILMGAAAATALGLAAHDVRAATTGVPVQAIIVAPIGITQTQSLNFGSLTENGAGGTSAITVAGAQTDGGGVTTVGGTIQAGGFQVTGATGIAFDVSVTAGPHTVTTGGGANMTLSSISLAEPGPAGTGAGITGATLAAATEANYRVGATLNVGAGQTQGTYNGTITLSANYQ